MTGLKQTLSDFISSIDTKRVDVPKKTTEFKEILYGFHSKGFSADEMVIQLHEINIALKTRYALDNLYEILSHLVSLEINEKHVAYVSYTVNYIYVNMYFTAETYTRINELSAEVIERLDDIDTALRKSEETVNIAKKTADNILPHTISVLGIFIAVISFLYGGFSIINAFEQMVNQSTHRLIYSITLTGVILFNALFLLIFLLSKLSDKRIHSPCKYFEAKSNVAVNSADDSYCVNCVRSRDKHEQCSQVEKIFRKYPYIYGANTFLLLIMMINGIISLCDVAITSNSVYSPPFFVAVVTITFIALIVPIMYFIVTVDKKSIGDDGKKITYSKITRNLSFISMAIVVLMLVILSQLVKA